MNATASSSRFFQGAGTDGQMPEGAGLGLALCRRLADALGGELALISVVGEGTTFFLTLDFDAPAEPREGGLDEESRGLARRLSVLIVDDIALNRTVARTILIHDGHQAVETENGEAALRLIGERDFDAVLLDLQLPGIDGYEVLRRIRAMPEPRRASLPVLAMTGNVLRTETGRMTEAGFDGIVPKPVDIRNLRQALLRATHCRTPEPDDGVSAAPRFDPGYLEDLIELLGADEAMPLVLRIREALNERIDSLWDARSSNDVATVRNAAHKLAGAAGNCGLVRLQTLLCDLEIKARSATALSTDLATDMDDILTEAGDVVDAVDQWISHRLTAGA